MTDTTSAAPSERKSFETHAKERGYRLNRSTGGGYLYVQAAIAWRAWQAARTQPTPPAVVEPDELSPDFTDTARAALLWVLWHHQGGSSPVGQPIRFALGMGQHDRLNEHQLAEAKRWERLHPVNPAVFPHGAVPLTDEQIEKLRRETFSTENPFCPCDSKTMRKAVWAAERAHGIGIGIKKGGSNE